MKEMTIWSNDEVVKFISFVSQLIYQDLIKILIQAWNYMVQKLWRQCYWCFELFMLRARGSSRFGLESEIEFKFLRQLLNGSEEMRWFWCKSTLFMVITVHGEGSW